MAHAVTSCSAYQNQCFRVTAAVGATSLSRLPGYLSTFIIEGTMDFPIVDASVTIPALHPICPNWVLDWIAAENALYITPPFFVGDPIAAHFELTTTPTSLDLVAPTFTCASATNSYKFTFIPGTFVSVSRAFRISLTTFTTNS